MHVFYLCDVIIEYDQNIFYISKVSNNFMFTEDMQNLIMFKEF
jgi:hypothetical protein